MTWRAIDVLKQYEPSEGLFPREHLPSRVAAAKARFADVVDHALANDTV